MSTIRIALIDDDVASLDLFDGYLKKFQEESGEKFIVKRFFDGDEVVENYECNYDIIFMDIRMKRMDGFSAAEYIRKCDKDVVLIFITNTMQYAIKGYEVDALNYLLKPVSYFAFSEQLKRSIEKIKSNKTNYLLISTESGMMRLDTSEILYIESARNNMQIYTAENTYIIARTMQSLEEELAEANFFRCSKWYLINLAHVSSINGTTIKIGETSLEISRARKKEFIDALMEFYRK